MEMVRNESVLGGQPTEEGAGRTRWANRFDEMVEAYRHPSLDGIRETKFGAIQAVQFFGQHMGETRGIDRQTRHLDNLIFKDDKRATDAARLIMAS